MFTKNTHKLLLVGVVVVMGVVLIAGCAPTGIVDQAPAPVITQEQVPPPENTQEELPPPETTQVTVADSPKEDHGDQASEETSTGKGRLVLVTVPAPSLGNSLIGEVTEQTAAIYLPPSYQDTEGRYPVLYYLPPLNDTSDGPSSGSLLELAMNLLLEEGKVNEMILVIPSARNVIGNTGAWVNSPVTGNWEDYVVEDLVPYIDANYRTLAAPASRGIAGTIIGGFGAYNLAMRHPDVFGSVYAGSPTLFAPDGLEKSWIVNPTNQLQMLTLMEEIAALAPEAAHERLLEVAAQGLTRFGGTVGYAMAFVADVEEGTPYFGFEYVYMDEETGAPEAVWQRWASGYGDWDLKTAEFEENFASLHSIALSYTEADQPYIRDGTQYASEQLEAAGIDHELNIRGPYSTTIQELRELLLPYFSKNLTFE